MIQSLRVVNRAGDGVVVRSAVRLLKRTVRERADLSVSGRTADWTVTLSIQPGIGMEGFRIGDIAGGVQLAGNDERGLLYAVGQWLRSCRFSDSGMEPGDWRGVSVPVKPVRGMYFASHFHNFYHDAPIAAVRRYIEELALWGCNTLSVWFDMHHYAGIDDPAAQAMIQRLRAILQAAEQVGMAPALTSLANEAYANSPVPMRADWTAGHDGYTRPPGGHYHVEICPHAPGGLQQILDDRRRMLEAFRGIDLQYFWIWPYDQGGCTCTQCAPWGANGFLKTAEPVARLVKEMCPNAKLILSTWYFDHFTTGEWDGIQQAFSTRRPDWVDYILADDYGGFPEFPRIHGVPGGFPAVGFPEISMERMWPWGGFGANPRPAHWQDYWAKARDVLVGFFPYSEGIFEDLNKVITFQLLWNPDRAVDDIVREYASSEFGAAVKDDVVVLTHQLETAMEHGLKHQLLERMWAVQERVGDRQPWPKQLRDELAHGDVYSIPRVKDAAGTRNLVQRIETGMRERDRAAWRWRIMWIRAELDALLELSAGAATGASEACFEALIRIYHARHAEASVLPPGIKALKRMIGRKPKPG